MNLKYQKKERVQMLDVLRGSCILLMIAQHSLYLMGSFHFFSDAPWLSFFLEFFQTPLYQGIWLTVVGLFFLIAGSVSQYSRNNLRRCLPVLLAAAAVTGFTFSFVPSEVIWFGVLHCMGTCMLVYGLLERFVPKLLNIPVWIWGLLFALGYTVVSLDLWIPPDTSPLRFFWIFVGFPPRNFVSADYFSLFPWLFLFLAGAGIGKYIKAGKFPPWFYQYRIPPIAFVGRHPLLIYILHQPVVFSVCWGISQYLSDFG